MDWQDDALITGTRPHGETSLLATVFTRGHGLARGLVRGARAKGRNPWQPGTLVQCHWRGRLPEQLGTFQLELVRSIAAELLPAPQRLQALASLCALLQLGLGEGEPHPSLYDATLRTLAALPGPDGLAHYAVWELHLLEELGFGLDLATCAVTGATEDLCYVSPKSGRAVSGAVGRAYANRLFAYPAFWTAQRLPSLREATASMKMTGYFLSRRLLEPHRRTLPEVRAQLQQSLTDDSPAG